MNQRRYHVHVCCEYQDLPDVEDLIASKLSDDCFFTWDLKTEIADPETYARQRIDQCDYVIFLVGSNYGRRSRSGASYLHLNYVYARTKQKPMMVLYKVIHDEKDHLPIQFLNFRNLIKRECDNVVTFSEINDLRPNLMSAFNNMKVRRPARGWVHSDTVSNTASAVNLTATKPTTGVSKSYSTSSDNTLNDIDLNESITLNYTIDAYKHGNMQKMALSHTTQWGEILLYVAQTINYPTNEDTVLRNINSYLEQNALASAKKIVKNVHAVTKTQIDSQDFATIKNQLISKHWVVGTGLDSRGRNLWQVTPLGKRQATYWRIKNKVNNHASFNR